MATLLASDQVRKPSDIEAVFATFDAVRRERCQWLVQSSRFIGDCYEWRAPGVGRDFKKIESEINERLSIIGDVNVQAFCDDATEDLVKRLSKQSSVL
jgi:salicylate hydroxylase